MNDGGLAGVIAPDNHADSGQPHDNDATLGARRTRSVHRALMTVAICQPDFGWPLRRGRPAGTSPERRLELKPGCPTAVRRSPDH